MKTVLRAIGLSLVIATVGAAVAVAQGAPSAGDTMFRSTTLNLAAYGESKIRPDMATIILGVMTRADTAAAAMRANATRMEQVMAALAKAGIATKDIRTSNLNLTPQYVYVQNEAPRPNGYQASNQVTVTVRDLAGLGGAVDATVGAGANEVNGISFGLNDLTAAENVAREKAVQALQAKADLYARATGYRVQRLVSLSESGGYAVPPPMPMPMASFAKSALAPSASQVSPGELRVRIGVNGLFELAR